MNDLAGRDFLDPNYLRAAAVVVRDGKCSTSLIQCRLAIGYNKAARLVERMEEQGIVGPADHVGHREVATVETIRAAIALQAAIPDDAGRGDIVRALSELAGAQDDPKPAVPLKETDADREVRDKVFRVAADELRQFIERFERLAEEKAQIGDQQKEVMASAKARGYDTKVIRRIIALRKRNADDIAQEEAVLEMYKEALGMG